MGKLSLALSLSVLLMTFAKPSTAQLYRVAEFGRPCSPGSLIMPTVCKMYDRTVKCSKDFQGVCECNLGEDALFDEEEQACVGRVDGLCFTDESSLGRKICTKFADCVLDDNEIEGSTIGKCQCLQGFQRKSDRTCEVIPGYDGTNGTMRTTTTRRPLFPSLPSATTIDPNATTTKGPGGTGGQGLIIATNNVIVITVILTVLGYNMF